MDLYFKTQEAGEAFRTQNPSFTRPDERCQPVSGQWDTMSVLPGTMR